MPDPNPGLMTVVGEALELTDPTARAAYLDRVCAADDALRRRVEALLAAHAGAGRFLEPDAPAGPSGPSGPSAATGAFDPAGPAEGATGTFGEPPTGREPSGPAELGTVVADRYTLVRVIGEGGMGSVYLATQSEPVTRQVALKLIRAGMDSKGVLARFDAERQALALMDHPNIARIYDGGVTETGRPFFVMELVNGVPLTDYCDTHRLPVEARLRLFVAVCHAVQHAHQKGVIHRDLKPGNVLVTEVDGRPTPKVIDFGVAKATELKLTDMSLADAGAIVGTPAYMSPEQADPSSADIDTRTDVYALGVILYELLVGSPPLGADQFKRGAILEMLRMVREVDPPKPSTRLSMADALPSIAANRTAEPTRLVRALRGDLDWIVMKALEKDRARRYDTANGFATDVLRHLAYEPVLAAPPGRAYRVRKFVRKNRGAVVAAGLVLLALLGGIAGTTWGLFRAEERRREAEQARAAEATRVAERDEALGKADAALKLEARRVRERDEAVKTADARAAELKYRLGVSDLVLAGAAYDNRDVVLAAERLDDVPPEQRGWEWHYLKRQTRGGLFTLYGHTDWVTSGSFSTDGSRVVTGSRDRTARVWEARTGTVVAELKGHTDEVTGVTFSPDGTRIVTTSSDNTARVWEARTGTVVAELKGHTGEVCAAAFSPDGTRIVTGGLRDRTARVWDTRTGTALVVLSGHAGAVRGASFSPDGTRVVTGSHDKTAKVWDARTGTPLLELRGHTDIVNGVAFSPDGTWIVTGSSDKTAKVWNSRTGAAVGELKGHTSGVASVSFSPDGGRIVTGGSDRTARVWDARTGAALVELKGHTGSLTTASFSPDGTRVLTGSHDKTAKVWDARTGTALVELKEQATGAWSATFSPDGTRVVTAGDKTAKVWDARAGTVLLELRGHTAPVTSTSFSPDGTRIVTGSFDKTARVWDARTGAALVELKGHAGEVFSVSFSPDGARVVTGSYDNTARVWDAGTAEAGLELKGHTGLVASVSFSPDGGRIVTGSFDRTARVWDARTGMPLLELKGHTQGVARASFSPDGGRIVTAGGDMTTRIWDAKVGRPLPVELHGHTDEVTDVFFGPDGTRVVTHSRGGNHARVWDARTGRELEGVPIPPGLREGRISPDRRVFAHAAGNRVVLVPLEPDAEEISDRMLHTRPEAGRYLDGYDAAMKAREHFAARFYLDRLLSLPEYRTTARFSERHRLQPDPLVDARTGFHHPALAKTPYDRGMVALLAVRGDRLARRLVAQEFLRDGKPSPAVPLLFTCLLSRPSAGPPVEELLLARAFLDLNRPDEAGRFYRTAVEWLDRPRDPRDNLGVGFAPDGDPRRNPFDWEAWHECDVFRADVCKPLATR